MQFFREVFFFTDPFYANFLLYLVTNILYLEIVFQNVGI